MAKQDTGPNGLPPVTELFGALGLPGIEFESVVATQRKNLEALAQASQIAVEGVQSLVRRQVAIARQAADEASSLLREWTAPGAPEEQMAKGAELAKQAFERNVATARELAELAAKAGTDVFGVLARRLSAGLDEMRLYAKTQEQASPR